MAVTLTAIALAESGGNTSQSVHNPYGEDSRGLWQINTRLAESHDTIEIVGSAPPVFDYLLHG
jgi:hypothetical protein